MSGGFGELWHSLLAAGELQLPGGGDTIATGDAFLKPVAMLRARG